MQFKLAAVSLCALGTALAHADVVLLSQSRVFAGHVANGGGSLSHTVNNAGPYSDSIMFSAPGPFYGNFSWSTSSLISTSLIRSTDSVHSTGGLHTTSSYAELHFTSSFWSPTVDVPFELNVDIHGSFYTGGSYGVGLGGTHFSLKSDDGETVYEAGAPGTGDGLSWRSYSTQIQGIFRAGVVYTLISEGETQASGASASVSNDFVLTVPAPTTLAAFLPLLAFSGRRRR